MPKNIEKKFNKNWKKWKKKEEEKKSLKHNEQNI